MEPNGTKTADGALFAHMVGRWLALHYGAAESFHYGEHHEFADLCKLEDAALERVDFWIGALLEKRGLE